METCGGGNPIYYTTPRHWEDATNDGQRRRLAALAEAVEMSAAKKNIARLEFANFLHSQFGVQTMGARHLANQDDGDAKPEKTGPFAVQTLGEDETIARLATGVKRFKLSAEFNFIKIFQDIADEPKTGYGDTALDTLAQIFENRRQYPRAADVWRRDIKEYGAGPNNYRQDRLDQIVRANGACFRADHRSAGGAGGHA